MTYEDFLKSSPRIVSSLNRMNQNYEKKILRDAIELVLPSEQEDTVEYADDLSVFF
jgi:hypothetical protein